MHASDSEHAKCGGVRLAVLAGRLVFSAISDFKPFGYPYHPYYTPAYYEFFKIVFRDFLETLLGNFLETFRVGAAWPGEQ